MEITNKEYEDTYKANQLMDRLSNKKEELQIYR